MTADNKPSRSPLAGLVLALREGDEPSGEDWATAYTFLRNVIRAQLGPAVQDDDIHDVVTDSIQRLVALSRAGKLDAVENVAGYSVVLARRKAYDMVRHSRRTHLEQNVDERGILLPDPSDQIAALETTAEVRAVLEHLRRSGDATSYQVVTFMLDHIEVHGDVPSSRVVGEALKISHTGVSKALARARKAITAAREADG